MKPQARRAWGRMVSDFTLTSQRENIAGLEVVCIAKAAGDLRNLLRRHATIRAGRLRPLSSKAARRVPRASRENLSSRSRSLSIARLDFRVGRRARTGRSAVVRIANRLACLRHPARRHPRPASQRSGKNAPGDAIAEWTLRSAGRSGAGSWLLLR